MNLLTVVFCRTAEAVTLGTGTLLVSTTTPSHFRSAFSVCLCAVRVWPFATLAMYIERSERGAKDPYGPSARSLATLAQQNWIETRKTELRG